MDEVHDDVPAVEEPAGGGEAQGRGEERRHGPGVAILLAAAAVATAVIGGRAAFLSADASTNWQSSVRLQAKEAAAYVEDIRYLYTVEVPQAVRLAEAQARSEELGRAAASTSGLPQSLLTVDQHVEDAVVNALTPTFPLTADPTYRIGPGYDLGRRLADVRNQNPELVNMHPERTSRLGDRFADRSIHLVAATVLVAGAFLLGSLAQGFPRRRRPFLAGGTVLLAAGLVAAVVAEAVA